MYLERLEKLTVVAESHNKELLSSKSEIEEVFIGAKREVLAYIHTIIDKDEIYSIELSMPYGGFWSLNLNLCKDYKESYRFPFGSCDRDLWEKLLEDKNNPLFKLLRFMSCNVSTIEGLLNKKDKAGVLDKGMSASDFNKKTLEQLDIFDNLGIIHYIYIYKDVDKYLNGEILA